MGLKSYIGRMVAEYREQRRKEMAAYMDAFNRCYEGSQEEMEMRLWIWDDLHRSEERWRYSLK